MKIRKCPSNNRCRFYVPDDDRGTCWFAGSENTPSISNCPSVAFHKLKKRNEILMLALRLSVPRKYLVPELIKQAYREMRKK